MTYAEPRSDTKRQWEININRAARKPERTWTPPKLTRDGRPFAPGGLDIGAYVTVTRGGETVVGQVWGLAPRGGVWVVVEGEGAVWVCASVRCRGGSCRHVLA